MEIVLGFAFLIVGSREFYLSFKNVGQEERALNEYEYDSGSTRLKGLVIGFISFVAGIAILYAEFFLGGVPW